MAIQGGETSNSAYRSRSRALCDRASKRTCGTSGEYDCRDCWRSRAWLNHEPESADRDEGGSKCFHFDCAKARRSRLTFSSVLRREYICRRSLMNERILINECALRMRSKEKYGINKRERCRRCSLRKLKPYICGPEFVVSTFRLFARGGGIRRYLERLKNA
jgi:hypothetical protein